MVGKIGYIKIFEETMIEHMGKMLFGVSGWKAYKKSLYYFHNYSESILK